MYGFTRLLILITAIASAIAGCGNRPTNGGSGNAGESMTVELTPSQKAAIDDVIAQVDAAAKAFAGTLEGVNDLQSLSLDSQATCPSLVLTRDPAIGTTIVVDFPDGCTNPLFGEFPVSGTVTMTLSLVAASLDVTFTDLTVDDQTSNGSLSGTYARQDTANTLAGNLDLTTAGVGGVSGTITLVIDVTAGAITLVDSSLGLDPVDGDSFSVTIADMVIVPVANGNFVPQSGTIAFDLPNDAASPATITIVVTFDDQSPVDRTVAVAVGSSPPVEYTLPGGM